MEGATHGLPANAGAAAEGSIGGAGAVAERLGGDAGAALSRAAETAFSSAMGSTLIVAAGVALAGAVVALSVLPGRERERAEKTAVIAEAAAA